MGRGIRAQISNLKPQIPSKSQISIFNSQTRGPVSFPSFGKINWVLKVLGKRGDGFHEVVTVLQTVDFADRVEVRLAPEGRFGLEVSGRAVALGEENLLVRAARALAQRSGVKRGVEIRLEKRLPVGGGMGGGSSNAATLLLFLNQLWECGLGREELAELGARLGSDVPFFLHGGLAAAGGRGTSLTRLDDPPEEALLLLVPPFSIATAEAYRLGGWGALEGPPRLTRRALDNTILRFRGKVERGESVQDLAENQFDGPLYAHFPGLARLRRRMQDAGCEKVMVCGSGSTLLGLASLERVSEAAGRLSAAAVGEARVCRTVSRRQYWKALQQSGLQIDSL